MQLFQLLFWLTIQKGEAHKKAIYGREIIHHAYSFVKSFCRDFLKNFFSTQCPQSQNQAYFCISSRETKSKAILNCRPFYFCAKNDFKSDFEIESENEFKFKIGFESDFQSENDLMFHVKHKCYHKKPIYGQKIVLPRFSFVKNFFQKSLWSICRPSPKKKDRLSGLFSRVIKLVYLVLECILYRPHGAHNFNLLLEKPCALVVVFGTCKPSA